MSDISTPPDAAEPGTEVHSHFVRERNVMMVEVAMGELYVDYYLHLAAQGIKPAEAHDALFKRALAAFVLHTAAQPCNVMTAWTINFQKPLVNLFLTGDNETGAVTGRVFADHVRELPQNLFYGDVVRGKAPTRRSSIAFTGSDPIVAVEEFYGQSEQRVGRFFEVGEERWVLLIEHPDCDVAWLRGLTLDDVRALQAKEEVAPLERRIQRWHCGCNQRRMMQVVAPVYRSDADELFAGQPKLEMRCPRCGARHAITREALEAFVASEAGPASGAEKGAGGA